MRLLLLLCLLTGQLHLSTAQNATFDITAPGSSPELDAAMQFAADVWSDYLLSDVPVKVNVVFFPLGINQFLGLTVPNGRKDFPGAPQAGTWYPSCLANALAGEELNPGEADMDIIINTSHSWYLGIDGNPANNQFDFVSTFLHEMGHGLGIASLANAENFIGSFGAIEEGMFAPFTTSFPFPELGGLPGAYDRFLETSDGDLLTDPLLFANPSGELFGAFTGNAVYFNGPLGSQANNGGRPRIHAPGSFSFGSSITHLNESSFSTASGNGLMTPFSDLGEVEHEPGPIVLGMLQDLGWSVQLTKVGDRPAGRLPELLAWPNPAQTSVHLDFTLPQAAEVSLIVRDVLGQTVDQRPLGRLAAGPQSVAIDHLEWPNGLYYLSLQWEGRQSTSTLAVQH